VLAPGASVTEQIRFSPTADGVVSETYSVTADDGTGPHVVTLNGTVESDLSPAPTIESPTTTDNWAVGDTISLSGSAVDYTGAPIPEADLTWSIRLHHCVPSAGCHIHPVTDIVGQAETTFVAPDHEYPSWLEVELAATDTEGTGTVSVEVQPTVHSIEFATEPSGLQLLVGSAGGGTAPFSQDLIEGSLVPIVAPTPQTLSGAQWTWSSWSDGGAAAHSYLVPGGPATVSASFAPSGAALLVSPEVLDFGTVAHGSVSTLDVVLTNPGSTDVTLTAVTPPAAPFSDPSPPAAGTVIPAGSSLTQTVELAPTSVGTASGSYTFEPDTGQGPITVTLTAEVTPSGCPASTIPGFADFADPAWQLNGDAGLEGQDLQLTAAAGGQAGTAFWTEAVASDDLSACFVANIGGGSGADGMALVLLDASAPPTATGAAGSGLGVGGLPATAVALDTYGGGGAGQSGNDVAIAPSAAPLAYSTIVPISPDFRGRDTQVEVTVEGVQLTVSVDNAVVATEAVTLPPTVYVGFSAATGGATDRHAVAVASLDAVVAGGPPDVSASPAAISFGTVEVGSTSTATLVFSNSGGTDATVAAVSPPALPFTDPAPLAVGTVIPAGGSVTTTVSYDPAAAGTDLGSYVVETGSGQVVTVPLDGTAADPASSLTATPTAIDFGTTEVGTAASATVTLANTGPADVTLSGVTLPEEPFAAADGLEAGDVIPAGGSVTQTITYEPAAAGTVTGSYVIETPDQTLTVSLTGSGSEPPAGSSCGTSSALPPVGDPSWSLNGSAAALSGGVELTGAADGFAAGSAFHPMVIDTTQDVAICFDAAIVDGTGADGMTVSLADATVEGATAIGGPGGILGFGGVEGVAITLDTWSNAGEPAGDFVGLATSDAGVAGLTYLATAPVPGGLDGQTRAVEVQIAAGSVTVLVDGVEMLSEPAPAALPAQALVGFTAGTGGATNAHRVLGATVAASEAPTSSPGVLSAPGVDLGVVEVGSSSGSVPVVVSNTGGSDVVLTVVSLPSAPFGASGAPLVGDVVAAGGSMIFDVSFDPVAAGPFSDQVVLESAAQTLVIALDGVAEDPAPPPATACATGAPSIPGPGGSGWTFNGAAAATATGARLTPDVAFEAGSAVYQTPIDPSELSICFDVFAGGGTGADGLTLAFLDAAAHDDAALGSSGSQLGFGGLTGTAVTFDTHSTGSEPVGDFVGLASGGGAGGSLIYFATSTAAGPLEGATHAVEVTITGGRVTVVVDGTTTIDEAITQPSSALLAFTAATGSTSQIHDVDNLVVAL
jgi:hypothetical protein